MLELVNEPREALHAFAALCIFVTMAYAIAGAVRAKRIEASAIASRNHLVLVQKQLDAIEKITGSNIASSAEIIHSLEIVRKQKVQDLADSVTMAVGHKQGLEEGRANPTSLPSPAASPPMEKPTSPIENTNGDPIAVSDKRTAAAAERSADASEKMAKSAERSAASAERSATSAEKSAATAEKSADLAAEQSLDKSKGA